MLFESTELNTTSSTKEQVKEYLVDVPEFIKSMNTGNVSPAPEFYSKENLANVPGMDWLAQVDPVLYAAPTEDPQQQREILNKFIEHLKAECFEITKDFSQAFSNDFIPSKVLALDLETTGLDTRLLYDNNLELSSKTKIVGISIASSENKGYYLPVRHTQEDGYLNWNVEVITEFLTRLNQEFLTINHNSQYDREVMAQNLVELRPFPYFLDTQLLSFIADCNSKSNGLKALSENLLGRKMVEIHHLFAADMAAKKKKNTLIEFDKLPVCNSYIYAASDAMNTWGLFKHFSSLPSEDNPFIQNYVPIQIDHKLIDVLRNLYRSGVPVDYEYCLLSVKDVVHRIILMRSAIYQIVGKHFDIQSPAQLSWILFDEMKIPVLAEMKRGKPTKAYPTGLYSTAEDVLDNLYMEHPDIPLLEYVVTYRKLQNAAAKSFLKMIANSFVDGFLPYTRVQAAYMMTVIPSGRLSSSSNGGKEGVTVKETDSGGLSYTYDKGSWDCGFNTQGIAKSDNKFVSVKKITKLPDSAGLNFQEPYSEEIDSTLVKMIAGI